MTLVTSFVYPVTAPPSVASRKISTRATARSTTIFTALTSSDATDISLITPVIGIPVEETISPSLSNMLAIS